MSKIYVGIDIGGTNVKCGIVSEKGEVLAKSNVKVLDKHAKAVVSLCVQETKRLMRELNLENVEGVGVGVPGLIDSENGLVVCAGNLDWQNEKLGEYFFEEFGFPVKIANDANVATLGEVKFGIGKDFKNCVMLTLGTGVGSGIIIDGKIYSGNRSAGAELGHMIIQTIGGLECTCGGYGCLETYASATALKNFTKEAMLNDRNSKMWEIGGVENVSGKTAFQFASVDASAKSVVDKYIEYLSVGIVNVANIFRPEAIILGGGVSYEGDRILVPLKKKLSEKIFAGSLGPKVELLLATLRNDAGFMGASALNM